MRAVETKCSECQKNAAHLKCGLCEAALCRSCAEVCNEPDFSFFKVAPKGLLHGIFCETCFQQTVLPQIDVFNEVMDKAKDVMVYMKDQSKESRLFRRTEKPIVVENCNDREDTLLRLAFQAVQLGFNAIVDVELAPTKVIDHAYQTTSWRGVAMPVQATAAQLRR